MNYFDERPGWNEYFMEISRLVATRSTCLRRQVGALLVIENRILATGYNGSPAGFKHCQEVGCIRDELSIDSGMALHLCRGAHSEQNLITQCARFGTPAVGGVIYITTSPCSLCMKLLVNVGVTKIVYEELYDDELSMEIAREAGIKTEQFKKPK